MLRPVGVLFLASAVGGSQAARGSASALPPMVEKALSFLPEIKADQVVILKDADEIKAYLSEWGYSPRAAREFVHEIKPLAEFTIDHHFPIFINASNQHYRRLLKSWEIGKDPEQAARVMASDLYHEYRHAAYAEDEAEALEAHVGLLKRWRAAGLLLIADPYIRDLED